MNTIDQIKQICIETDNEWFLTHDFTKIALQDLLLKEHYEKENIDFDERICVCEDNRHCTRCDIEHEREDILDELNLYKNYNFIYDFKEGVYTKSKWIISEQIDGEIPGFILIKCCNGGFDEFTHQITFACVRYKYRNRGILKNMLSTIPKEWNILLEASSSIDHVEKIWEKCGFVYYDTINGHLLYTNKKSVNELTYTMQIIM